MRSLPFFLLATGSSGFVERDDRGESGEQQEEAVGDRQGQNRLQEGARGELGRGAEEEGRT